VGGLVLELGLVSLGFAGLLFWLLADVEVGFGARRRTLSAVLPVREPIADWIAPEAEST
jgi:hypothetical protein